MDSTLYFTETFVIEHYIGIWVISYGVAFCLSVLMEAPLLTLEKTLLFPPKPQKQKPLEKEQAEGKASKVEPSDNGSERDAFKTGV